MAAPGFLDPEIERLTEKLAKDPNSMVFAPLADSYRRSGLIEEAIDIVKKGLDKHPRYASAYIVLGRCYQDQKMYELARAEFEKVLEIAPENFVAAKLYANMLVSLGQKEEAIKRFKQLLETDPGNAEVKNSLEQLRPEEAAPVPEELSSDADPSVFDVGTFAEKMEPAASGAPSDTGNDEAPDLARVFGGGSSTPETEEVEGTGRSPFDFGTILDSASEEPEKSEKNVDTPPAFLEPTVIGQEGAVRKPLDLGGIIEPDTGKELLPESEEESGVPGPYAQLPGQELPETPEVDKGLAEVYVAQGATDRAIETYEKLLEKEPSNEEYKRRLEELRKGPEPVIREESIFPSEILEPTPESSIPIAQPQPTPEVQPPDDPGPKRPSTEETISLDELFKDEDVTSGPVRPKETVHPSVMDGKEKAKSREDEESKREGLESFQNWLDGLEK